MNQKKIGNKLYVFSETAYEITQDTDASVILIQQECIDAYKALNSSAVNAKIKPINYKLFCVQTQEWMDYYNDLTVTVGTIVGGTVTASPTSADEGEEITLTHSASTGYEFTSWDVKDADNNSVTVTNNKFAMPASNVTVNAVFDKIDFDITIDNTIQNGTLSAPSTANLGDTVTITATPSAGYKLDTLTVMCGSLEVTVVNSQFTMPAGDVTITGTFAQSGVTLNPVWKYCDGFTSQTQIVTSLTVSAGSIYLELNDTEKNINFIDVAGGGEGGILTTVTSSNTSVVTVNAVSSGSFSSFNAVGVGTATITTTWPQQEYDGVMYAAGSATIPVTVKQARQGLQIKWDNQDDQDEGLLSSGSTYTFPSVNQGLLSKVVDEDVNDVPYTFESTNTTDFQVEESYYYGPDGSNDNYSYIYAQSTSANKYTSLKFIVPEDEQYAPSILVLYVKGPINS